MSNEEATEARSQAAELRFRAAMLEEFANDLEEIERRRNRAAENARNAEGGETRPVKADETR